MESLLVRFAAGFPAIIVALALHEYGHAAMATKMGDPTPRMQGRLTLNPIAHLHPTGTIFIIITLLMGFGFGWGKPVETNPSYYTDYKKGRILVAIAGPAMNLCQAMIAVAIGYLIFKANIALPAYISMVLAYYIMINIVLMVFNMLPIPLLDGGHVLEMMLPWQYRENFRRFSQFGFIIILALMWLGVLWYIISFFFQVTAWLLGQAFGYDYVNWLFLPLSY